MVVMGYRVPKGTPFMLTPYAAHVSASNFLQPYKFSPERWLNSAEAEHIENKGASDGLLCMMRPLYLST